MAKIGRTLSRSHSRRQSSMHTPAPEKKALIIGINYTGAAVDSGYCPLHRAREDAKDFKELLISNYRYEEKNVVLMVDDESVMSDRQPTRKNILNEIKSLVKDAQEGSQFTFFYSGHSGQVVNPDRINEEDGLDEFLVPVDHDDILKNLAKDQNGNALAGRKAVKKCMIIDNKLRKLLVDTLPVGACLTAIFDSCHSATLLDLDHYLCNNVYNPRLTAGHRRYKSRWQNVRRKDGQRMSQPNVTIITKKQKLSDGKKRSSSGNVRIYQRARVSEHEMDVTNTSVGVSDVDGKKRKYSIESKRKSVQVQRSRSIAEVMEDDASITSSLAGNDGAVFSGQRCASPSSFTPCNGFCDYEESSAQSVLSISSCQDAQTTYEAKIGSFTESLITILRRDPQIPIRKCIQQLSDKMYEQAQKGRRWHQRHKDSLKRKQKHALHPVESNTTIAFSENGKKVMTEEQLNQYDFNDVPKPQVGGMTRLDLEQPVKL